MNSITVVENPRKREGDATNLEKNKIHYLSHYESWKYQAIETLHPSHIQNVAHKNEIHVTMIFIN